MMRALILLLLLGTGLGCGPGLVDATHVTWLRWIGAGGGTIVSKDGRFEIVIPEGALEKGVSFEIVERTTEESRFAGKLYEVTPIDVKLAKPATVRLKWTDTPMYLAPPRLGTVEGRELAELEGVTEQDGWLVSRKAARTAIFGSRDACAGDDGCGGGLICEAEACVPPECTDEEPCGRAFACDGGRCARVCEDACQTNDECPERHACVQEGECFTCVATCIPDPAGEICDNGVDDDCDGKADLDDPECPDPGCKSDDECESGYCVEGVCVQCKDNLSCDYFEGQVCYENQCGFVTGCIDDQDCPEASGCMIDRRGTYCLACMPELACDGDAYCKKWLGPSGICTPFGNTSCLQCRSGCANEGGMCPDGGICRNGNCVDPDCTDADGDGYPAERNCGTYQIDCNDSDPNVHPGRETELCNGADDNCNGSADEDAFCFMGVCKNGRCQ